MTESITLSTTTQPRRAQLAPRARGYRIIVYHGYGKAPAQHLPIIFSQDIPSRWEEVMQDTSVTQAVLIRSGRKVRTWTPAQGEQKARVSHA